MKKSIFLFFAAILYATSVWAVPGFNQGNVYFDKSGWNDNCSYIYLAVGHDTWSSLYRLDKTIQNTQLVKGWCSNGGWWNGMNYFAIMGAGNSWGGGSFGYGTVQGAPHYTAKNNKVDINSSSKPYLCTKSSADNGATLTITEKSSITDLNYKQTIQYALSIGGTNHATMSSGKTPGKITMSSYKFVSNYDDVSEEKPTALAVNGTTYSREFSAAHTATTKLTVSEIAAGYKFDGWYTAATGGTELSTSTTYTYYPTAATTIYARFSEDVYYLAGTLDGNNAWNADELPMEKNSEGNFTYTFTNLAAGEYKFKVTDGTWKNTWDSYCVDGNYYDVTGDNDKNIVLNLTEETTFTITFNKAENKITFTGLKPATYTVAGDNRIAFGDTWNLGNTSNDMNLVGNLYTWTKTKIGLRAGTEIQFKVVKNHNWDHGSWPTDNNWVINTISQDGFYTITITFNEVTKNVKATATWTGEAPFKDFTNQPAKLYFYPTSDWKKDNAQFAAYFYNEGFGADAEPKWQDMTDPDGDGIYELDNAKEHEYVMFCRMNPSRSENNWDADVAWNKIETGLVIPNTAGELNICCTFWTNAVGNRPTSECVWVVPTPLADNNWSNFVSAYSGKKVNALIKRTFRSGQNHTLCLPFNLPTSWLGDGSKAYQLNSIFANTAEELQLNASECNTIEAGKPYIIVPVKGSEYEHIIVCGVTVKEVAAGINIATGDGYKATLKAVTTTGGQTNGSTEYYVGANDGYLYNAVTSKLGLRAIIELTTASGQPLPAKVRARVVNSENAATGVDNITNTDNTTIKVIENGQLIIIRNGEKFNAQGVRF